MSDPEIMRDQIINSFKDSPGDEIECRCCNKKYKCGDWNFYNLCDPCFNIFNTQRMNARFGWNGAGRKEYEETIDTDSWVKTGKCTHLDSS